MTLKELCFGFACLCSSAVYAQNPSIATFGTPSFRHSDNNACGATETAAQVSPSKRELSIIFSGRFLDVGKEGAKQSRARCAFDLVFSEKLKKPETIRIDVRGSELKNAAVRIKYEIVLGQQTHNFEYVKGRIIEGDDPAQSTFIRRFELADIPKGTRKVSIAFKGKAESSNKGSYGYAVIDSLDVCIADPQNEAPDGCGGTAKVERKRFENNSNTSNINDER